MADPAQGALADQALENLINQFARPLDFLRELVQNSVDAGSPRVEVRACHRRAHGVLELSVQDWGEGMDEEVIDACLTRLFASSKEGDESRIGRFGIGFTSVFALRPEAVLVRTGRHDQGWELLFRPDLGFDKVRLAEPVTGTCVTLFKALPAHEVEPLLRDVEWTLGWWCEHLDTPVLFGCVPEAPPEALPPEDEDPLAAFAAPPPPSPLRRISGPLALEASPQLHHQGAEAELVIGYAARPRRALYNGGLTLVNTDGLDVLGRFAPRLGHLAFKVKSRRLEHTLTRDNVLQDASWERVMAVVVEGADRLRGRLVEEVCAAAQEGRALGELHGLLLAELGTPDGLPWARRQRLQPLFRVAGGRAVSPEDLEQQEARLGELLLARGAPALLDALVAEGLLLVEDDPQTRRLLAAWPTSAPFPRLWPRRLQPAAASWRAPGAPTRADPRGLALVEAAADLLGRLPGARVRLRPSGLGGAGELLLEGPPEEALFSPRPFTLLPGPLRPRTLHVDLDHPRLRALSAASLVAPGAAAMALAQLALEGVGDPRVALLPGLAATR